MAVSLDNYDVEEIEDIFILSINGVNFHMLDPENLKDGFTEIQKCHPDFTKFFKRYFFLADENVQKWGL